jgi:hypothetical protein
MCLNKLKLTDLLHVAEELVEEFLPLRIVVDLVELEERNKTLLMHPSSCSTRLTWPKLLNQHERRRQQQQCASCPSSDSSVCQRRVLDVDVAIRYRTMPSVVNPDTAGNTSTQIKKSMICATRANASFGKRKYLILICQ